MLGGEVRSGLDVGGPGAARRWVGARDSGQPLLDHLAPWRVGWRGFQHGLIFGGGGGALAVLLLSEGQPEAGLEAVGAHDGQFLVGRAGGVGDDAVVGHDGGFGKGGEPLRRVTRKSQEMLKGIGRIGKALHAQIDRRDQLPAARVIGAFGDTRFDGGNQIGARRGSGRDLVAR